MILASNWVGAGYRAMHNTRGNLQRGDNGARVSSKPLIRQHIPRDFDGPIVISFGERVGWSCVGLSIQAEWSDGTASGVREHSHMMVTHRGRHLLV